MSTDDRVLDLQPSINEPTLNGVFRRIDRIEDMRVGHLYLIKCHNDWDVAFWSGVDVWMRNNPGMKGDDFTDCQLIYEIEKADK